MINQEPEKSPSEEEIFRRRILEELSAKRRDVVSWAQRRDRRTACLARQRCLKSGRGSTLQDVSGYFSQALPDMAKRETDSCDKAFTRFVLL